jgi:triosephosphate isomerase
MARRPLIAGNWKMHYTHLEGVALAQKIAWGLDPEVTEAVEVVVHPPLTALRAVGTLIQGDKLAIGMGAQNCHQEPQGAYTGEVSAPMLAALGCQYVIVGHSERRQFFAETDATVAKKVKAVFASGMTPIACVGESLAERDAGRTEERISGQVRAGLGGLDPDRARTLVVAYEPIWAIGTGRNAEPSDAGQVIGLIRETLADIYSEDVAQAVRVQYGGSVKPGNIRSFMAHPEVDGALVGGASLDPEEFALIVKYR